MSNEKHAAYATSSDTPPSVGETVHRLRRGHGLTLDELARRSGVSKSMLSQIERNRTNPTFATVWRLTNALGIGLEEVLRNGETEKTIDLVPGHAVPTIRSADGKCLLRILGPLDMAGSVEWYELIAEPGAALVSQAHDAGTTEHLSVLEGSFTVESGDQSMEVAPEATGRFRADQTHAIRNPGQETARAFLVVALNR